MGGGAGTGSTDLFDGQHQARLTVVVVVGDGDDPGDRAGVGVLGDHRILGRIERVIVD